MERALPDLRRKAIVVLGMHRSGTSALTGVLAEMGCVMPEHLMAPEEMNPKGFFESDAVTGLNEELLASAGLTWYSFPPFPRDWYRSARAEEFAARADETLRHEYADADLFAMKDPRICRLVPFWDAVLRRARCRPLYVCTHRHPIDVAQSLQYRSGYDLDYGLLLWLRHQIDAEADSRGKPRVFVSYDQLMADWAASVSKIGAALNIAWPLTVDEARPGVEGFLSSALRNFAGRDEEGARPLPDWVAEVYGIVERWSAIGEDAADYPRLDAIRAHLDAVTPTLGGAVWGLQSHANDLKHKSGVIAGLENRLVTEAGAFTERLHQQGTALVAANEQAARLNNIILQRAQEVEDRTREAAQARAQLDEMRDGMDHLRTAHEALVARHARESRQLQQMTARVATMMLRDVDARLDRDQASDGAELATEAATMARVNELERQLEALTRHSTGLEVAVQELTTSTSWAMTRPLRWVSARVRRRR